MAALKCPVHGRQENTGQTLCAICMEFLVPDVEPVTTEPQTDAAQTCPEPGCGTALVDGQCPVHSLGAAAQPRVTTRDQDLEPPASVLFPWGAVEIDRDEVWVGRSPDCGPIAAKVDRYDNISRRHAVLLRRRGELWLRDQGSTNGTYVNERRLDPDQPRQLNHGDVIRFAADLRATVQLPGHSR